MMSFTPILNQDLEQRKIIYGSNKFLEIRVQKMSIVMFVID